MELRVSVETKEQLGSVLEVPEVGLIYLDEAAFPDREFSGLFRKIWKKGKRAGLRFRRISRDNQSALPSGKLILNLKDNNTFPDAVLIRNLDEIGELLELGMISDSDALEKNLKNQRSDYNYFDTAGKKSEIIFDYSVYIYNEEAIRVLSVFKPDAVCLPIELSFAELFNLRNQQLPDKLYRLNTIDKVDVDKVDEDKADVNKIYKEGSHKANTELLVYGHLPMMVSANCLYKTTKGCVKSQEKKQRHLLSLEDRKGFKHTCICYCKYCYNQIYNADALVLYDLQDEILKINPDSLRYDFTYESGREVLEILSGSLNRRFTRGHFHKKVL